MLEFTPEGLSSRADERKARFLVLNFMLSKCIIPVLAGAGDSLNSSELNANGRPATGRPGTSAPREVATHGQHLKENGKLMGTVLYWVLRAALLAPLAPSDSTEPERPQAAAGALGSEDAEVAAVNRNKRAGGTAEGSAGAAAAAATARTAVELHEGDASVLAQLFDDRSQGHVVAELIRSGWLANQRDKMLRCVSQIYLGTLQHGGVN